MKKVLAFVLAMCVMFAGLSVQAFATDVATENVDFTTEAVTKDVAREKVELISYPYQLLDGYSIKETNTELNGQNLKLYLYIETGSVKVQVRKAGATFWSTVDTWGQGHHWVDLAKNCKGTYQVRLFGTAALFSGGAYIE